MPAGWWFQQNFERRDVRYLFFTADNPELDDTARPLDWDEDVDLRWLMLRMITECAQHCGHLDRRGFAFRKHRI